MIPPVPAYLSLGFGAQLNATASEAEKNKIAWTVYGIFPDSDPGNYFYIGISKDIRQRAQAHNGRDSAAYAASKVFEARGIDCTLEPITTYPTLAEARAYEVALIAIRPGLVNRDVLACQRAFAGGVYG